MRSPNERRSPPSRLNGLRSPPWYGLRSPSNGFRSPEKRLLDSVLGARGPRGAPESFRGPLKSRPPEDLPSDLPVDLPSDLPVDARPSDGRLSRRLSSFEILFLIIVQHHCWE